MTDFSKQVAIYPSTPASYDDPFFSETPAAVEDSARPLAKDIIATYADIVPTIPNKADVNAIVLDAIESALFDKVAAQQALSDAVQKANATDQVTLLLQSDAARPSLRGAGRSPHRQTTMTKRFVRHPVPVPRPGPRAAGDLRRLPDHRRRLLQLHRLRHHHAAGPRRPRELPEAGDGPTFWLALQHSFVYLIVTPILIVLSIVLAIIVNRALRGIHIYRALYFVPAVSGSIAIGLAWTWLFERNGFINSVLLSWGLISEPVQWLATPALVLPIAMLLTIWAGVGFYSVIFLAGLQNIPEELYDAARIDGVQRLPEASPRQPAGAPPADRVRGGDLEPRGAQGVRRDLRPDQSDAAGSSTAA